MTRTQSLHRSGPLSRQTPLRKRSRGRGKVDYQDAKARKICMARWGEICLFTKEVPHVCWGHIDAMHAYGKQAFAHLRFCNLNLFPGCRALHDIFTAKSNWALQIMLQKLSPVERSELERLAREGR